MNVADARGLTFECQPGCGFCCTNAPLVLPGEAGALPRAVALADGTLRIPLVGAACSALGVDRRCLVYDARPHVCRLFPYAVHAGRRVQATVSLACPGVHEAGRGEDMEAAVSSGPRLPGAFPAGNDAEAGATRAAEAALAQPGAAAMAARAKATFAEFDRRMTEWGVAAPPDRLRAALLPHVEALADPALLPAFLDGVAAGALVLDGDAAGAVRELFATPTDATIEDIVEEAARDAFDAPEAIAWVEPDLAWTRIELRGARVRLHRQRADGGAQTDVALDEVPLALDPAAKRVLAAYLARLVHRDHTEGTAAWLVDASRYEATPAAAYARVVAEASLHVALRAGILAAAEGADTAAEAHARRAVGAYETAYHSLPTLGAIL